MRISYWSNSKVADAIRKLLGLPKNLSCGTSEEWNYLHELEQKTSPIGIKIIESLDVIQSVVYFIPDSFNNLLYWVGNVLGATHVLRTKAKFGVWSDLTNKLPEAILLSIVDFIEIECFHMYLSWDSTPDYGLPADVLAYRDQSYIRRKLFCADVTEAHRGEYGLKYIVGQMTNTSDEGTAAYQAIIDAYKFAKDRFKTFDPYEESGYNLLPTCGILRITAEHKNCFETIRKLEEEHTKETILHCTNMVKYHEHLWT